MTDDEAGAGPLAGLRVLELDSPLTAHAGRLLWELGADVVLVEPAAGSSSRSIADGTLFAHHHAGKRSVTTDAIGALLAGADVVLEGATSDSVRLDAAPPEEAVHVVVSPYGTTGPRAAWHASDLVVGALGGMVSQIGWPDGAPEPAPADQAWHLAACNGAIGALLALSARARTAIGQAVEVSALECVAAALETGALLFIHADDAARRNGTSHPIAPHRLFRAADGWLAGGLGGNPRMWTGLLEWMDETGEAGDLLGDERLDPARLAENREHVSGVVERFTETRRRVPFSEEAQRRRLPWAAVLELDEVASNQQLLARGALVPVDVGGRMGVDSAPPVHRVGVRRASPPRPRSSSEASWDGAPVRAEAGGRPPVRGALDDITVLDLTWVLAGPFATRILADHGATVVKIESRHRPDPTRFSRFSHLSRGEFDPDTSGYFNNLNRNKRSVTLNLRAPEGVEAFLRLVASADVVIENFSSGSLDRMGIGPKVLQERNPGIVVVSMSGLGATGPSKDWVSYADAVSALSGFTSLSISDGRPNPVVHGLADIVAGHHAALAALAALLERRRTGVGAVVDLSQLEAIACQTGHSLLARTATGASPSRRGSGAPLAAPEGVYRCLGPDRWVALTVCDDDAWRALCDVIDRPDLAGDARLASAQGRLAHVDLVDAAVSAWTSPRAAGDVAERLQASGIPAGTVQDGRDLVEHDPQLRDRGFYRVVEHPRAGPFLHEGIPIRLSSTPGDIWEPAPLLGADTDALLAQLGGLDAGELAELRSSGAVE